MVVNMDNTYKLGGLLELACRLGLDVRCENLAGRGGGACQIQGNWVLFVDVSEDLAEQIVQVASALAHWKDQLEQQYILPEIRQLLDNYAGE